MTFYAKVIEDSENAIATSRITTLELSYPRFIHGEFMTHRVFSRNAMSSRAIPVSKMIEQVRTSPAAPVHWGANQPGMQAGEEVQHKMHAQDLWNQAAHKAADYAQMMMDIGLHKQVANRILEPFQWMRTIVTATEWDNFFELRCHPDAQPEFQKLANLIKQAMDESEPVVRDSMHATEEKGWHLPYVSKSEREEFKYDIQTLCKISTARCARVSYLTHDGLKPELSKDLDLFHRLAGSVPIHASPLEHQAMPSTPHTKGKFSGNLIGWEQFRKLYENNMMSRG